MPLMPMLIFIGRKLERAFFYLRAGKLPILEMFTEQFFIITGSAGIDPGICIRFPGSIPKGTVNP